MQALNVDGGVMSGPGGWTKTKKIWLPKIKDRCSSIGGVRLALKNFRVPVSAWEARCLPAATQHSRNSSDASFIGILY